MPRVDVFGTIHADRPRKVEAELSEFCDGVDVVFVEAPRESTTDADERTLLRKNPVFKITAWLLALAWGIPGLVLTGRWGPVDDYATTAVAAEHGADVEPVDKNLVRRAGEVSVWSTVLSWALLWLACSLFVLGILLPSVDHLVWAVVVAFVPIVPFAYGTLGERDETMAENIEDILTAREDVQHGCLVVGRGHVRGVVEDLAETDVEVGRTHKSRFVRRTLDTE